MNGKYTQRRTQNAPALAIECFGLRCSFVIGRSSLAKVPVKREVPTMSELHPNALRRFDLSGKVAWVIGGAGLRWFHPAFFVTA
jgi:hypothetical protein